VVILAGEPVKLWRGQAVAANGRPGQILAADSNGIVVACGEGALRLTELQKPGGRRLASADFLRGTPLMPD
jgi:methionyl-tRNA formyltransferase